MSNKRPNPAAEAKPSIRCAIYTRKSTEEGLEQAFNSLDAQRESAEAYISAQRHEGWTYVPDKYDDGGFSGGNMDRPALARLLADISAGKVDCVVVYKVDRLSRSLLDFSRIMEVLDKHKVSFVSVTQQFNTTHSMGRLTLNILLSFAQFEREIISERTRDKIAAARRKGKWSGGKPLLGYDVHSSPAGPKLVVNEDEARRVRAIYDLYLQHEALIPTVQDLARRGWRNKEWTTKKANERGGRPFDKCSLYALLTSRTYLGLVTHKGTAYHGEHPAIIEKAVWEKAQAVLKRNGHTAGAQVRNKHGALLKGLIHCSCCRCSMGHSYASKAGKRYRYYVCLSAQKKGWDTCPSKSVPAGQMERFVMEQIKCVGRDPAVLEGTLRHMRQQNARAVAEAEAEQRAVAREITRLQAALRKATNDPTKASEVREQAVKAEQKVTRLAEELIRLKAQQIDRADVAAALSAFDPAWEQLTPKEQARVIRLLVERVEYDGKAATVAVTFHPSGIKALAREQGQEAIEVAA